MATTRLHVAGIAPNTTADDLRQLFAGVARVAKVTIPPPRDPQLPRGYAFVEVKNAADADAWRARSERAAADSPRAQAASTAVTSAAKPEAEDASPAAVGKSLRVRTSTGGMSNRRRRLSRQAAIFASATGKSPGPDGLPAEFYREFAPELGEALHGVITEAMSAGELPESLRQGDIILLYKKGRDATRGPWKTVLDVWLDREDEGRGAAFSRWHCRSRLIPQYVQHHRFHHSPWLSVSMCLRRQPRVGRADEPLHPLPDLWLLHQNTAQQFTPHRWATGATPRPRDSD